ncbi:putative phage tail protein [uncultured Methylobacterium sp.]|uniref:putative phage tail protein n=1 Tax=uncultured Methylobacterium sp. TaxID=157278 RepID=UPI0035CA97AC
MSDTIPAGWPCALLPAVPPSVADRQSAPSADDLLPQVLALTPRGAAWGRDEAGDGRGASPVMRRFWRAVAGWVADVNARDFTVATQTFPSAATIALADWETELGLPDPCMPAARTVEQRVAMVRARFGAQGGASPAYFACVATSLGHAVTIEEPDQFLCDVSECVAGDVTEAWFTCTDPSEPAGDEIGDDGVPLESYVLPGPADSGDELAGATPIETWFTCSGDGVDGSELGLEGDALEGYVTADESADVWADWVVHLADPSLSAFSCSADGTDGSVLGAEGDPLEGYTPALDLECLLRRLGPQHTRLHFSYDAPAA